MQIIGAGFARTGTLSTQAALQRLGYPCYHMARVILDPDHLRAWHDFLVGGEPMDWHGLFRGQEASVDFPVAWFYREVMHAFPDARILLNVREPERWYDSYMTLAAAHEDLFRRQAPSPELNRFRELLDELNRRIFGVPFDRRVLRRQLCIRTFEEHVAQVRREVAADRLLVFRVQDGWDPLCRFLGCEVPAGEPFPHLNEGGDTLRKALHHAFPDQGDSA